MHAYARLRRNAGKNSKESEKDEKGDHADTWRPMSFSRATFSHREVELAKYFQTWSPGNLLYSPNVNFGLVAPCKPSRQP